MRILITIPAYYPAFDLGGPIPVVRELARRFAEQGHEVTIWTTNLFGKGKKLGNKTEERTPDGIRTVYFNSVVRYRWVGLTPDVYDYLRREGSGFDVIHIHGYREFLTLAVAHWARRTGKPYVLQSMGTATRMSRSISKKFLYDMVFGHAVLQKAARLIAESFAEREQYLRAGITQEKISLIPNGIDFPQEVSELKEGEFRRTYGFPAEDPLILFLGRIHPVKGVELLIRAFSSLQNRATRLAIVGPDEGHRRELERLVTANGIGDRVVFTGPLYEDRKWEAYLDANIYVLPSMFDNFPRSVLEAMGCGTPVVVTDRCGLAPQIENKAGLVVPYEDRALTRAIEWLVNEPELRETFSERGRRLLEEEFSWDPIVEKLESLYEEVVAEARGRQGYRLSNRGKP